MTSTSKKGRSASTQRELSVVMPSGQGIQVKCEVKSRCGDVFDMIVAHSNLVEHFYFGLAYIDGRRKRTSSLWHKLSRHQYYLQLRKDLLEDRLSCHEETSLCLAGLALQAEYGDCMPEVYGRNYYRPDQYIPKSVMEKRALPYIRDQLLRLHISNAQMLTDESELEFLKVTKHTMFVCFYTGYEY
ncbi:hypothetical protein CRUP_023084 [Coryphaenoides rupestris]|nr:hypothetical protein CRUP_023084 [Coryphaenoides rupestris]